MCRGVTTRRKPESAQQAAATPHELPRGEVAEAGRDVVEEHLRRLAVGAQQHDTDGLVAALDEEGVLVPRRGSYTKSGLKRRMSAPWTRSR